MRQGRNIARGAIAAIGVAAAVTAAPAAAPTLLAVARIAPGQWQIKTVGSDDAPRLVCVADPASLLHYNRRGVGCEHKVMVDRPDIATVQYRCTGTGSGSATVHVATPRAFDLDMQGLDGGLPYEDSYEAHRVGDCPAATAHSALR